MRRKGTICQNKVMNVLLIPVLNEFARFRIKDKSKHFHLICPSVA